MKQNIQTQVKETKVESPTKKSMTETTRKSSEWTWEKLMEMGHKKGLSNSRYDGDGTEWIYEVEDNKLYKRKP